MRGKSAAGGRNCRVMHAERRVDLVMGEVGQRLAGKAPDDFAHQNEIDIAVNEMDTGRAGGLGGERLLYAGFIATPFGNQLQIRRQTGEMRHQEPNGNVALAALKFGQVLHHRIVNAQLALFEQTHHRGRGGDDFRKGGGIEDGVERHRLVLG